jgi:hypothetical protein
MTLNLWNIPGGMDDSISTDGNQETSKDLAEFLEHFLITKWVIYAIEW